MELEQPEKTSTGPSRLGVFLCCCMHAYSKNGDLRTAGEEVKRPENG